MSTSFLITFLGLINALLYGITLYYFQVWGVKNQIKADIYPSLVSPEPGMIILNAVLFKLTLWCGIAFWFNEHFVANVFFGFAVLILGIFLLAAALHDPIPESKRNLEYSSGMFYPSGIGFLMILCFFILSDLALDRIIN